MKRFILKGKAIFYAEDVVDAFRHIGLYYTNLAECCDADGINEVPTIFEPGTNLCIGPYKKVK